MITISSAFMRGCTSARVSEIPRRCDSFSAPEINGNALSAPLPLGGTSDLAAFNKSNIEF